MCLNMLLSAAVPLQTDPAAVPHWGRGGTGPPNRGCWLGPPAGFSRTLDHGVLDNYLYRTPCLDTLWLIASQKKMSKCDATRCQTLRVKCIKFDFYWGSVPDTAGGGLQRPRRRRCI